jgi:hypothetical protein
MKANELRIGNYVRFSEDGTIFTVDSIEEKGLVVQNEEETAWIELEEFEPIPLTEEWFLKFGFEIKNHFSIHKTPIYFKGEMDIDYCFSYADFREDYSFYVEYTDSPFDSDTDKLYPVSLGIKYVHQLQNLWFTLTGEELI